MRGIYDFALDWVRRNYPNLFPSCLSGIEFLPVKGYAKNANGLCYTCQSAHKARITLALRKRPIEQIINTLVHELTHAVQFEDLKKWKTLTYNQREDEAYAAGRAAEIKYLREVGRIEIRDWEKGDF